MSTHEIAKGIANESMYNTIIAWSCKYANIADNAKDGKIIYACNQKANHFYMMAREFHQSWIEYKMVHNF